MRKIHIMGSYHTDLAWRGDERQYADYLEQFVVILVDILEQNPEITYVIEQAYHYRSLLSRRPDLIEKLKKYIAEGRIEVMGGMMSTADTNVPGMESLVRNQLMGLRWFNENMDAQPKTGWLFDSFGLNAQLPQILASFGMKQMFGSRFGGEMPSGQRVLMERKRSLRDGIAFLPIFRGRKRRALSLNVVPTAN